MGQASDRVLARPIHRPDLSPTSPESSQLSEGREICRMDNEVGLHIDHGPKFCLQLLCVREVYGLEHVPADISRPRSRAKGDQIFRRLFADCGALIPRHPSQHRSLAVQDTSLRGVLPDDQGRKGRRGFRPNHCRRAQRAMVCA